MTVAGCIRDAPTDYKLQNTIETNKMTEDSWNIVIVLLVIISVFSLIFLLDKRVTKKGALFTRNPSKLLRVLAIIVGILFLGFFVIAFFVDNTIYPMFVILGGFLIGYGLNFDSIFKKDSNVNQEIIPPLPPSTQPESATGSNNENRSPHFEKGRVIRFVKTFSLILIASIGLVLVSIWASRHQENPFSEAIVIGVIILYLILIFGKGILLAISHLKKK
jgi:uncharacterized BrkB/YihY/UPF0761 family membrane protein